MGLGTPCEMALETGSEMMAKRRNADVSGIIVIEMHVQPILSIMSNGHNISGVGLLTPLRVGTTKTMGTIVIKLSASMIFVVVG